MHRGEKMRGERRNVLFLLIGQRLIGFQHLADAANRGL